MTGEERIVDHVALHVDRDGLTGGMQISINVSEVDINGKDCGGHGYRLAGPKYIGQSKGVKTVRLGHREAREIRRYLDMIPPCEHPTTVDRVGTGETVCIDCGATT